MKKTVAIARLFKLLEGDTLVVNYGDSAKRRYLAHVALSLLLILVGFFLILVILLHEDKAALRNLGLSVFLILLGVIVLLNAFFLKQSLCDEVIMTSEGICRSSLAIIKWEELENIYSIPGAIIFETVNKNLFSINVLYEGFSTFSELIDIGLAMRKLRGGQRLLKEAEAKIRFQRLKKLSPPIAKVGYLK